MAAALMNDSKALEKALDQLRRNRRAFRRRGFTLGNLTFLEAWMRHPWKSLARLGRDLGISRQRAWQHAKRLEALGAVVRTRRFSLFATDSLLRVCAEGVRERAAHLRGCVSWKRDAAAKALKRAERRAASGENSVKPLEKLSKSACVKAPLTHIKEDKLGRDLEMRLQAAGEWEALAKLWEAEAKR